MDGSPSFEHLPPAQRAEHLYQQGLQLKQSGNADAALTEFRRAVLSDPAHIEAQMEIGRLCKSRMHQEPALMRIAFEAFRASSRLDPTRQEAHDAYILVSQKMGRLDDLLREYDDLAKYNPDNEMIQRCRKNILTISMAMMPDKVNIDSAGASNSIRGMIMFLSVGAIVIGVALMVMSIQFRTGPNQGQSKALGTSGMALIAGGLGGFLIRSRLN